MCELLQNHFISEKKQWEVVTVPFLVNRLIEILSVTPSFDWCLLTLQNNLRTKLCWPILLGSQYGMAHHNECFWCFSATFIRNFFRITKASATLHLAEWKVWKRPHFTCCVSERAVATLYLGMVLVFMGFGSFPVSETAIKQPQNLKLMREIQSTGQTDSTQYIRCLQMCPRALGCVSKKSLIFLSLSTSLAITLLH